MVSGLLLVLLVQRAEFTWAVIGWITRGKPCERLQGFTRPDWC